MSAQLFPAPIAPIVLGWRELAALPQLGIPRVRAKIDTGARSCALHVDRQWEFTRHGVAHVGFLIHRRRGAGSPYECEAPVHDRRIVTDSSGRQMQRVFLLTRLLLAGVEREVEISLADRGDMLFPLLVGRSALRDVFAVDPSHSFLHRSRARPLDPR